MKTYITKILSVVLLAAPLAFGQTTDSGFDYNRGVPSDSYGPRGGDGDFMIGGSGTSNKHFDDSTGGVNFSAGHYLTATQALVLRQTISYSHPKGKSRSWDGATRLAFDQYLLDRSRWRPFLGANFGGVYGDNVRDTWAAGLEAGVKFYVQPRVFIELVGEYDWYFRHSNNIDDRFDTGQWNWAVGTGFTF